MSGFGVGLRLGSGGGGAPTAKAVTVPVQAGSVYTISRLLGASSVLSLLAGTNGNLTLSENRISATAPIGAGTNQTAVVREAAGPLAVEYPVTIAAQVIVTPTPTPAATPTSKYGMNLNGVVYYNGIRTLTNLAAYHLPQMHGDNSLLPASATNAATGVVTIPSPGASTFLQLPTVPGARVRLRHAGTCVPEIVWNGANVTSGNDGTYDYIEFDTTPGEYTKLDLPAGTLTYLDAREPDRPLTQKFDPLFVADMSRWSVARMMDWQFTNQAYDIAFTASNRPKPYHLFRLRDWGQSFEECLDLAAAANVDPWICIPWRADKSYVDALVSYAHSVTPAGRQIHFEAANEVWNSAFSVYHAAHDDWLAGGGTDYGEPGNAYAQQAVVHNRVMGWVEAKASKLGASVGENGRFVRHLGVQFLPSLRTDLVDRPNVSQHTDRYAIAPYCGDVYNDTPATTDIPTIIARMTTSPNNGIDRVIETCLTLQADAVARGKKLSIYEAGLDLLGASVQISHDIHYHPNIKPTFAYFLRELGRALPGVTVNIYQDFGPITIHGPWGIRESIHETAAQSPRYAALVEARDGIFTVPALAIVASPAPATQGQPFSYTIDARWGVGPRNPKAYTLTGSVPPGLTFDAGTGVLSGTPTSSGAYAITSGVSDGSGSATRTATITVAAPEVYAYDDDARSVGNLPATGAGASRLTTRGWASDIGYASNGVVYNDNFPPADEGNVFAAGLNSKNREVLVQLDTATWTGQYDGVVVGIVALVGGKGINVSVRAIDGRITYGIDNAYAGSIGFLPVTFAGVLEFTLIDGALRTYMNGNPLGSTDGYDVGTDYASTQPVSYRANLNIAPYEYFPIYSRFAAKAL